MIYGPKVPLCVAWSQAAEELRSKHVNKDKVMRAQASMPVGCVILIFCVFLIGGCGTWISYNGSTDTVVVTVTDKESTGGEYRVFTDNETFVNEDSTYHWKWFSADIQGKIKPGHTYELKVCGWRWGFMSWFRNILSVKEIQME